MNDLEWPFCVKFCFLFCAGMFGALRPGFRNLACSECCRRTSNRKEQLSCLKTEQNRTDRKIQNRKLSSAVRFSKTDFGGFGTVFHAVSFTIINGTRFYRALESVSIASALSSALTIYPCQNPSPSTLTVLNSNSLQLGRRSGGRPQLTVYPRRLPVKL